MGDERQHLLQKSENGTKEEPRRTNIVDEADPEGGWGWLVVLACFMTNFVIDGVTYSFGMLMKPLMAEMDEGNFGCATIGSIQTAVSFFIGPFVARAVTKMGARKICMFGSFLAAVGVFGASFSWNLSFLMVCYSLVTGIGFGFMYIPAVVASQEHFTKRRALAQGIALCGTGMGTLVFPPFVEFIIAHYGWRITFRVMSGICLGSVLCGAAMFPGKNCASGNEEEEEDESSIGFTQGSPPKGWRWLLSLIVGPSLATSKSLPTFLIVMVGDFLATMSLYIPYTHLPEMAMARGVSSRNAAFLISAAGIGSTVGRILAGLLCDQSWLHPMTITLLATALASLQAFLLISCTQFWMFLLLSSGFGFMTGFWVACETPLIIRTLSFNLLTPAFGLLTGSAGLGALIGAPLAGIAVDMSKTDKGMAVVLCGCIMGGSALAYGVATVYRKHTEKRQHMYTQI